MLILTDWTLADNFVGQLVKHQWIVTFLCYQNAYIYPPPPLYIAGISGVWIRLYKQDSVPK